MITKEQFLAAKNKYKENKFSKFFLDKFLRAKTFNNYKKVLIGDFLIFNILTVIFMNINHSLALKFCLIGNGIFIFIALLILISGIINMIRAKRLCNELNCNIDELNQYENMYSE